MTALGANLCDTSKHYRVGAYLTQADRHMTWQRFDRTLRELGYVLPRAASIRKKHTDALINHLIERHENGEITIATLKNDLAHLRTLSRIIGKKNLIPAKNKDLGIGERDYARENKASKLDVNELEQLPCERMKAAVQLAAAFGMRREEAIKFTPSKTKWAGDSIGIIKGTKGGRYREIPIITQRQRDLLEQVKTLAGGGSLIPPNMEYRTFLNKFEYETSKHDSMKAMHRLRHNWAQAMYKHLSGGKSCPIADKPNYERMTTEERKEDLRIRWKIARMLGHNRIYVTTTYLG